MNIIEGGDLLDVRLTNLGKDLFLLFSEYLWIYYGHNLDRRLNWSCHWFGWILLLFLTLPLEFGELSHLLVLLPLLFRVDVGLDLDSLRLGRGHHHGCLRLNLSGSCGRLWLNHILRAHDGLFLLPFLELAL